MTTKPLAGLAALAALLCAPAQAAVTTGTLNVSALVVDTCLVAATPLAFGAVSSAATTVELAPAVVAVTCTAAKPTVTVTVDGGASPDAGLRQMSNGGDGRVPYRLYADSGRASAVAVDGTLYAGPVAAVVPTLINVYGAVPAGTYAAGAYVDAATITVSY